MPFLSRIPSSLASDATLSKLAPDPSLGLWPLGIQGKLVTAFMLLLILGLEADGFLYASQTRARLVELLGEQGRQIAYGLSLASAQSISEGKNQGLHEIGQNFLRTRNVLFVVFYDAHSRPISISHRDPDYKPAPLSANGPRPAELMTVQQGSSPLLGDYVEVWAPILGKIPGSPVHIGPGDSAAEPTGPRLLGFVSVGISQSPEQAQLSRINLLAGLTAAAVVLCSLPIVLLLIHRIFLPIRQLVTATNEIAAGSYDTQVDADRADLIGALARAFNAMVKTVKRQQDDLEEANRQLDYKLDRALADLKDKNAQLEELAATEPLTGLYNRRHFGRVLDQMFSEASRYGDDLACVMIDLDGYKPLNDTFGHAVGDRLLVIAGQVISANMRRMDVAARYGGDEFVLLLPRAGGADATAVVERIREEYRLASAAVLQREQGVTMSVGIATLLDGRPARADLLVIAADAALYQAKAAGRNRSVVIGRPVVTPA